MLKIHLIFLVHWLLPLRNNNAEYIYTHIYMQSTTVRTAQDRANVSHCTLYLMGCHFSRWIQNPCSTQNVNLTVPINRLSISRINSLPSHFEETVFPGTCSRMNLSSLMLMSSTFWSIPIHYWFWWVLFCFKVRVLEVGISNPLWKKLPTFTLRNNTGNTDALERCKHIKKLQGWWQRGLTTSLPFFSIREKPEQAIRLDTFGERSHLSEKATCPPMRPSLIFKEIHGEKNK